VTAGVDEAGGSALREFARQTGHPNRQNAKGIVYFQKVTFAEKIPYFLRPVGLFSIFSHFLSP
jgi:hypothetical protein